MTICYYPNNQPLPESSGVVQATVRHGCKQHAEDFFLNAPVDFQAHLCCTQCVQDGGCQRRAPYFLRGKGSIYRSHHLSIYFAALHHGGENLQYLRVGQGLPIGALFCQGLIDVQNGEQARLRW